MSIINNSHAIGIDTRNLVLKTRGSLHVKVGDRYYEIDFRNLSKTEEDKAGKEEFIISIDNKNLINSLEYPGDNKLIVGLDGSLFVTKENIFIEVTPKTPIINQSTSIVENISDVESKIGNLKTVYVENKLYGDSELFLDFTNGNLTTEELTVTREINLPPNTVKNKCCKTHKETNEDGIEHVRTKYSDMDFIEIEDVPEKLIIKSGVMIKSTVNITIPVFIGSNIYDNLSFEEGGLYIIYENGELIQTKLN